MPTNIFEFDTEKNTEVKRTAKNSICFLPAGMDQKYHTGEEWRETVRKMNEYFGAVVIIPVDELHRFTEMMKNRELTEIEATAIAKEDGDAWLSEVEQLNKKFRVPVTVSRWSEWVTTPEYSPSKNRINDSYNNENSDFRTDVDIVILTFVKGFITKQVKQKNSNHHIRLDIQKATELCKLYLLEELAFVDMIKNRHASPQVSSFFADNELSHFLENPFFMAYPFGHNSTNEDVYNCFEKLCSDGELSFINLSRPPKKPRQRKNPSASIDRSVLEEREVVISRDDMTDQISNLQNSSATIASTVGSSPTSPRDFLLNQDTRKNEITTSSSDDANFGAKQSTFFSPLASKDQEGSRRSPQNG